MWPNEYTNKLYDIMEKLKKTESFIGILDRHEGKEEAVS